MAPFFFIAHDVDDFANHFTVLRPGDLIYLNHHIASDTYEDGIVELFLQGGFEFFPRRKFACVGEIAFDLDHLADVLIFAQLVGSVSSILQNLDSTTNAAHACNFGLMFLKMFFWGVAEGLFLFALIVRWVRWTIAKAKVDVRVC